MITTEQEFLALGFLGVGWIGRNRMEAIVKNIKTSKISIAEPNSENAQEAMRMAKNTVLKETPEGLYNEPGLDGIVIATPSALHAEQSIAALRAGKAVFCQKPLGRTAKEVKSVVAASKEMNKLLSVDLSYRYTSAFKAVLDVIRNQEIGKIFAVNLCFHNAYGPDKDWFYDIKRSGGGCVMDLGIHLIDLAMLSLGFPDISEVNSKLFAQGEMLRPMEEKVEDFARVSMTTEAGTAIDLSCSWNISAGKDAVIEAKFYGTKGGVSFRNIEGSFYDFQAEKYYGTQTEILASPPDQWSGRAGVIWAKKLLQSKTFDEQSAEELIKIAEIIDRIYGR